MGSGMHFGRVTSTGTRTSLQIDIHRETVDALVFVSLLMSLYVS